MKTNKGVIVAFNKHIETEMARKLANGGRIIAEPSSYQRDIFAGVRDGDTNIQVSAVPGSGKTTTLLHVTSLMPHIQFSSSTIHSAGLRILHKHLGKIDVHSGKNWKIAYALTAHLPKDDKRKLTQYTLVGMISYAKLTNTPLIYDMIVQMCNDYDLPFDETAIELLPKAMDLSKAQASIDGIIDYDDMLYLPHVWDIPPIEIYDYVFVDEMQDLNNLQWHMVRRLMNYDVGRLVAVGDEKQGMYLFAGASGDTFGRISELFGDYQRLPLSISYRCPLSHIEIAQRINPAIEPRDNAPVGDLERMNPDGFLAEVQPGDLVLCRFNAPLFSYCLELIRRGRRAHIKGRALHSRLTRIVDEVKMLPGFDWSKFRTYLQDWLDYEIAELRQREASEYLIEAALDRATCLNACYTGAQASSPDSFKEYINDLFDPQKESVMFSSIHRAKGLEAGHVFILHYDQLPATREWQSEAQVDQERNIKYVAVTRSKQYLGLVNEQLS